jgi:hypothetical protein
MRLPMLAISLLAAVPGAAGAQTATVVAPAATVSGVTVTNAGTYKAQSVSAPSGAGQLSPTGTIGLPGVWTEQIWYQDRKLAERTFTVSGPEHGDHFRRLRHRSNNLSAAFMRRLKALTHVQTHHRQTSPF